MLDLQQLSSFLAVVRAGSFVAAAVATNLSKAAVSRHVAELEAHLGVPRRYILQPKRSFVVTPRKARTMGIRLCCQVNGQSARGRR